VLLLRGKLQSKLFLLIDGDKETNIKFLREVKSLNKIQGHANDLLDKADDMPSVSDKNIARAYK
jgi:hypothetical protein